MGSFVRDGMINDWDLLEKLLNHVYKDHIRDAADQHPVLMSEAPVKYELFFIVYFYKY